MNIVRTQQEAVIVVVRLLDSEGLILKEKFWLSSD